jgi:hypothetical protein
MHSDLKKCEHCLAVRYKSDPFCPHCGRPSISPFEANDDTARTSTGTIVNDDVSVCNPVKPRKYFYTQTPK